ncbi:MAG: glycoside hydrolase [Bacteroidota bacterium]|nr:glycoside hydrolase [Bacteroidota bacterium]
MKKNLFKSACFLVFMLISSSAFTQNLIKNPGFESDKTNWNGFWSKEGTGSATVVSNQVHSGNKAIKIEYPGTQDWAFTSTDKLLVSPGSVYDLSCWTMISALASEANFSVILYDASQTVVNWAYSRIKMDSKSSVYTKFSTSFIVPEGIKYIQPRFEGWGSCLLYADDVSLSPSTSGGISGDFTVENDQVKAVIKLPMLSVKITNKTSSKSYQTGWAQFVVTKSVDQISPQSILVKAEMLNESKTPVSIEFSLEGKALKMKTSGDASTILNSDIKFPGIISSQASDFLIVPRGTGIILPVSSNNPFGNFTTYGWKSTMPFVGVTNLKDGYMVATNDQWDAEFQFQKPVGQSYYSFQLNQKPAKNTLSYNRTVYLVLVDNGYLEMCNWYREHAEKLGYVKTFTQKKAENPNIDKLIGAVDFWPISMNIKPEFLDTVKLLGIDKAMWNLTGGWGKPNFSVLIDAINSRGFLSNRYDIFTDVWPPDHSEWSSYRTEGYPEDVIVDATGQLKKGWLAYVNTQPFQGYYTCAETHLAYAKKHVPEDLATNRYNSRFIDVELAASLEECFSTVHPATRKQDAEARNKLLSYIKNDLNLVTGVEEAHDFAFPNADYGEGTMTIIPAKNAGYDWSQPLEPTDLDYAGQNISPAMRIPLHGLVYHDVHIPTWYTGDGASKVPAYWDDKNLWNILYGTMPLYMPPSKQYWYDNLEKFISGYHLMSAVTRNVGYSKMTGHQFVSSDRKIQKTTFDNGWNVVANFDSIPHVWNNMTLAAKGFFASGGKTDEAYKLVIDNKTIGFTLTGNRLFFNPFGTEASLKGLRTTQSVFCEKFTDYLLVSFIGKQNYLDLNVVDLPFDIQEITRTTEYFSGATISLTTLTDGWKRLNRATGKSFFKLYYKSKISGTTMKQSGSGLKVFPNPAQNQLTMEQSAGNGYVSVYNLRGEEIIKQAVSESKTQLDIGPLASGMYFLNLVQDGSFNVRKFVKE